MKVNLFNVESGPHVNQNLTGVFELAWYVHLSRTQVKARNTTASCQKGQGDLFLGWRGMDYISLKTVVFSSGIAVSGTL